MHPMTVSAPTEEVVARVVEGRRRIGDELRKVVVGQDDAVDQVLIALFTGGHCLLTGVPGLAKTLLVRTLAEILDLSFKRIQFTPDLMPADITGTEVLDDTGGTRALRFVRGPVFAHVLLADEINRTPPKTQAALLEAMQEYHVTAGGRDVRARAAVPGARDAEPDRAGGHLSAARSAARSLHVQHRDGLPLGGRRGEGRHRDDRHERGEAGAGLQRRRHRGVPAGRAPRRRVGRGRALHRAAGRRVAADAAVRQGLRHASG